MPGHFGKIPINRMHSYIPARICFVHTESAPCRGAFLMLSIRLRLRLHVQLAVEPFTGALDEAICADAPIQREHAVG